MIPSTELIHCEMPNAPAPWVLETARRPLAFAQVREDASLDQWVVEQIREGTEILMVASGGCSAAALAAMPKVSRLHLIDLNPAQIALSRLKLQLLASAEGAERLGLLGHSPLAAPQRRQRLTSELRALDLPADALGPIDFVAEVGPDQAGRYETLFAELRLALTSVAEDLTAVLHLRDTDQQSIRAGPATPLGRALDAALDSVMALPNLVGLFGEAATRNRCEPFSRHFARRLRHVLATLPAADNPYLWQMLQGSFPRGVVYPWLSAASPPCMPEVVWSVTGMAEALQESKAAFDFIHLSNILDWLAPEDAQCVLDLAWKRLRRGGWIFVRQLNSNLNVRKLGVKFSWQSSSDTLHERDRSFFYHSLHLGRKE